MPVWKDAGDIYLRSLGIEPLPELREAMRTMSMRQSAQYVQREYGVKLSEDELVSGINRTVEDFYREKAMPKPGVPEFLELLKRAGVRMAVATATDRYLVEMPLKRTGLGRYFEGIFTCTESGHGKDEPHVFRDAANALGGPRESTWVFEDSLFAAETAKRDGFMLAGTPDASEEGQAGLRALSDVFIEDFGAAAEAFAKAGVEIGAGERGNGPAGSGTIIGGRACSGTCAAGRAVIIAGADIKDYSAAAALLRPDDFMIYCDSGLRHLEGLAAACGEAASPGLIIGDFDSHEKPEASAETIVLPVIKDDTDSFFAAKQSAERGFGEVLMLGCLGGRLDHTLANVSAMLWLRERGVRAFAADGLSDMEIVMPGETALVPDSYPFFSLVTIDGTAEGVSIRGAKYELEDAVIESSFQYAVSNEPLPGRTAEISLRKGRLLLIKDRC